MLNVYTCVDHGGHWPVGVASVVVAGDETQARGLLDTQLREHGLNPDKPKYTLLRINTDEPRAFVLRDGDY